MARRDKNIQEIVNEFWSKVEVAGDDECWEWKAYKNNDGYGRIYVGWTTLQAHRLSWEIHNGEIPEGLCALHTCDNPPCVNPNHLFLGTREDNNKDRMKKGRHVSMYGSDNPNSKLSEKDVIKIRKLYFSNEMDYKEISKKFKISHTHVFRIVNRDNWANI